MDYLKLHEDILEILPDGTIQELMEIAYRHVQRPILATNVTYTAWKFPERRDGRLLLGLFESLSKIQYRNDAGTL